MAKFTIEQINEIIGLKGADGKLIDIFDLHGVLFIGNSKVRHEGKMWKFDTWDLARTQTRFSESSLPIRPEDFADCDTPEEVKTWFKEELRHAVLEKLL